MAHASVLGGSCRALRLGDGRGNNIMNIEAGAEAASWPFSGDPELAAV